jgi:peptide/nickel transport system substrate-binding protein
MFRWVPKGMTLLLAATIVSGGPIEVLAQKSGGTLRIYNSTNPPSASIHEEATIATVVPFAALFSNLVMYDPTKPRNSFDAIVPELAESWSYDDSKLKLTFKLRQGVKWHDGKPFTAKDVQCTFHRLNGKEEGFFRRNPRKIWYENLTEVTVNGDHEATFHLGRHQPSFIAMLASGFTPLYPCHVDAKDMRTAPIGTGPFKLASFKSNDSIKLVRNPDYWKKGFPYVDAIDWRIIPSRSTRILAFSAGEFDLTFVADVPAALVRDVAKQSPAATCAYTPTNVPTNIIINRDREPFGNADVRRAVALSLDRKSAVDILSEGKSDIAGWMLAPPVGAWGMPPDEVRKMSGYDGDLEKNRGEARKIMEGLGYGPNKRLTVKVSTRDFASYRDAAVLLVDYLNQVYFDAHLDVVESSVWFNRLNRYDYSIGLNLSGVGIDDPDVTLAGGFACTSEMNRTKYCNPEIDALIEKQSREWDIEKRRQIVWEIERKLAADVARPVLFHNKAGTCWHPHLKGYVHQENSIYNNWRFETVWLDK